MITFIMSVASQTRDILESLVQLKLASHGLVGR